MLGAQRHTSPDRQLSDYDEALLLDRAYVHPPLDGQASPASCSLKLGAWQAGFLLRGRC